MLLQAAQDRTEGARVKMGFGGINIFQVDYPLAEPAVEALGATDSKEAYELLLQTAAMKNSDGTTLCVVACEALAEFGNRDARRCYKKSKHFCVKIIIKVTLRRYLLR